MNQVLILAASLVAFTAMVSPPQDTPVGEQQFRALYKELVETNTTPASGSCTLAAERMGARLRAAGFADGDLHPFSTADHPKDGGLVVVYPGLNPKLGEEVGVFNGAEWLTQNRRDLIDAAFALNEGAQGELDANGMRVSHNIEAGQKTSVN